MNAKKKPSLDDVISKLQPPQRSTTNLGTASIWQMQSDELLWNKDKENPEPPVVLIPKATPLHHEDPDDLGLLTQYIGPTNSKKIDTVQMSSMSEGIELQSLKRTFLDATDTLDRAENHKTFLTRALRTEKIPPKLKISIKPLIMKKDDPVFQNKWNQAVKQAEHTLIECLVEHLEDIMLTTNKDLRESTKEILRKLKTQNNEEEAKQKIKTVLDEAQEERTARNTNRRKRKLESNKEQNENKKNNKTASADNH